MCISEQAAERQNIAIENATKFVDSFFEDDANIPKLEIIRDTAMSFVTDFKALRSKILSHNSGIDEADLQDLVKLYGNYYHEQNFAKKPLHIRAYLERCLEVQLDTINEVSLKILNHPLLALDFEVKADRVKLKEMLFSEYSILNTYSPMENISIGNFVNTNRAEAIWTFLNPIHQINYDSGANNWGSVVLAHLFRNGTYNILDVNVDSNTWHEPCHWILESWVNREFELLEGAHDQGLVNRSKLLEVKVSGRYHKMDKKLFIQMSKIAENSVFYLDSWIKHTVIQGLKNDEKGEQSGLLDKEEILQKINILTSLVLQDVTALETLNLGKDKVSSELDFAHRFFDIKGSRLTDNLGIIREKLVDINEVASSLVGLVSVQLNFLIKQVESIQNKQISMSLNGMSVQDKLTRLKNYGMSDLEIVDAVNNVNRYLEHYEMHIQNFIVPYFHSYTAGINSLYDANFEA